ncbi:hypothetical protein C3Y87_20835 [Carbonactinospora thermoautotrophica]|uniref:DUF6177 family protein n=1 Tax=Carbonactinospora thermoautotrophica TaxID=1469144 RepID=UPI0022701169|nr:DUF6177 family protein [Carbonactinospora thermoautotrophica]MCX9193777.1 hypothetical protein [Carbonactinospora thermoautotrophica]
MTHPTVDVVTERVAVVLQDRPVVPLTSWLAEAIRLCVESGRGLQVVTPMHSRLTLPLHLALRGPYTGWVVRDGNHHAYYDAASGRPLAWNGERFAPTTEAGGPLATGFVRDTATDARQLLLTARVRHPAKADTVLGGPTELLFTRLTGAIPAGWGTSEPATQPWERGSLTRIARRRAPRPSWFVIVGGGTVPAIGTVMVRRTASGVEEQVSLGVGYRGELPLGALEPLAAELVGGPHRLVSFLAQVRTGRVDLTVESRFEGLPVPVGLAIGPDGVAERGLSYALAAPAPAVRQLSRAVQPAVWLELGPADRPDGWAVLDQVVAHFGGTAAAVIGANPDHRPGHGDAAATQVPHTDPASGWSDHPNIW